MLISQVGYKPLKTNSSKLREFVQAFGPQLSIFYYLVLVPSICNKKLEIYIFSEKIVTSFVYIFTMEKVLVKIIYGR